MQYDKHGSSLDKTKLKLLEAANLVDKVTLSVKTTNRHSRFLFRCDKSNSLSVTLSSTPTVLQASKHPCGLNRSGGVDQRGHDQRLRQPSWHFGGIPVLETQTAPRAPQRQCSAHHVSHSSFTLSLTLVSPLYPPSLWSPWGRALK